jgi:hypothetical protein
VKFIALANTHYVLRGPSVLGSYPQDGSRRSRYPATRHPLSDQTNGLISDKTKSRTRPT